MIIAATAAPEWMQPLIVVILVAVIVAAVAKVFMPAKKCPACRSKVDKKATICAKCQTSLV